MATTRRGVFKRQPVLPRAALAMHEEFSKSTLHEALLDLWLEFTGRDVDPETLDAEAWAAYKTDVLRRASLRRNQGAK